MPSHRPFTLMIQGTTSDAGKSTLATGLCRLLHRKGYSVAPFKPQNMALNSAVTIDGGEIGRAQAVQAYAAGIPAHTDMNPVLLKPNSDTGAQVIIQGHAVGNMNAIRYHDYKLQAKEAVMASFQRLRSQYHAVIVEGAGSPAEINLRDRDIANMGFAEEADCPVILIADIDKGGVFAHLVGTLALLSPSERKRVIGFVINRFRGDLSLLQPGLDWLEKETGKPVLGVLPYLQEFYLEAEDAPADHQLRDLQTEVLNVVIPRMPRMSNHTDWDALRLHPQINVQLVKPGRPIPPADLVILPGSKSVQSDLSFLQTQGWPDYLQKHLRYGGKILGICGGFQMLGEKLMDPLALESDHPASMAGMGWINMTTELTPQKQLKLRTGYLPWSQGAAISGYEIHAGKSTIQTPFKPFAQLEDGTMEGYCSADGAIIGTYLHGLFDHPDTLKALLQWVGVKDAVPQDYDALRNQEIDRLADTCEEHLNLSLLWESVDRYQSH